MSSTNKERIDVALVQKGFFDSREKAKTTIMAGLVFVNNQKIDKPGTVIDLNSEISVKGNSIPFVSRGGLKLEKAVNSFKINLENKNCMDIGASTGGFTDCMLKSGASIVYAIDVGYGQLAWSLRNDSRVVCMERTNIRYIEKDSIKHPISFASIDVSFISLTKVLPVLKNFLTEDGEIVALIKPQFEAGREKVGKKGVVREKETHIEVIEKILSFCEENNFYVFGLDFSPIKGPEGNIEFLVYLKNSDNTSEKLNLGSIELIVEKAHSELD